MCKLVGCYILSLLTKKYGRNIGLYHDDGLAALNGNPQGMEKIKELCNILHANDLKITVEANTTIVNFLDVTLDLRSSKHYPFTKEGNIPLYVDKDSNHPPSILRNIPESINKRLSEISSDKECLDDAKHVYQEALNKSGYRYNLTYNMTPSQRSHPRRNRQRNITWYNLSYSRNVETNVGKCFLSLIDQHFPKSNPLYKIFNQNTVKLSYSCMNNIKSIISSHNKAKIRKSTVNDGSVENMIYQAELTTQTTRETYIGLCDTPCKLRYRNHICSFCNKRYRNITELSKHIWNLKDRNIEYNIKWCKIKQARSYSNVTKNCNLCL